MTDSRSSKTRRQKGSVSVARCVALEILYEIESKDAYANLSLDRILRERDLGRQTRAFVTELVYGTVKMRLQLDYLLGQVANRPIEKLTVWIRNILRLGLYQALYLRVPAPVAVHQAVELAKRYGHQGTVRFVNGVLRNVLRQKDRIPWPDPENEPVEHLSVRFSHPEWLVKLWLDQLGWEDTAALCEANNKVPPMSIRTNIIRISRDQLALRLEHEGVEAVPTRFAPEGLHISGYGSIQEIPSYQEGLFQVQDESSMLVGHLLSPHPGESIIDLCSAPGGKSTHAAELMQNRGTIISIDIHPHKLRLLQDSAQRLGLTCIQTVQADARQLPAQHNGQYDAVLLDAPCSGLGVLRRKADLRWRKEIQELADLQTVQRQLLSRAASLVRVGGRLVFSTCTLTTQENEANVKWFLSQYPEFTVDVPDTIDKSLVSQEGWVKLFPHIHGTDGFFMIRMVRRS